MPIIMAAIKNTEGLSASDINRELSNGAKFVVFQYCVSIIVMTFKQGTDIYFIRPGESTIKNSIGFTLITLFFGWWGIPWVRSTALVRFTTTSAEERTSLRKF
jgi:hypothetical protein